MYYEEKIIDGQYYCRHLSNAKWMLLSNKELTSKIELLQARIKMLENEKRT